VLFATRLGMGLRVPLLQFKLRRRGGKGLKGCKFSMTDRLLAIRIVSGCVAKAPAPAKQAWALWYSDREGKTEANTPERKLCAEQEDAAVGEADVPSPERDSRFSFRNLHKYREQFAALAEVEQQPYLAKAAEHRQRRDREMEHYRKAAQEEILVGTKAGHVSRLPVCSTAVKRKGAGGRPIVKLPQRDELCFLSLLSATEVDDDVDADGEAEGNAASTNKQDADAEEDNAEEAKDVENGNEDIEASAKKRRL